MPIPVAERSKACVCGRSLTGAAGSDPTGRMDVSCKCCVLYRSPTKCACVRVSLRVIMCNNNSVHLAISR
jgi:hypothetical protein